jgi:hypothetical protein
MNDYQLRRNDAAALIYGLANVLAWVDDNGALEHVRVSLAESEWGQGNMNVYVDGMLMATLRLEEDKKE